MKHLAFVIGVTDMRVDRKCFENWIKQLDKDIAYLNSVASDPVFGGDKFELGHRGKHHRLVLIKNGETIACGMREITEAMIKYLRKYR